MSKERLEMIKNTAFKNRNYDTTKLMHDDVVWLTQQAERVEELEEGDKRLRRHIFEARNDVASQSRLLEKAQQQNKRYREALEFYAISGQGIGETKHGEVAREALEGDSDE